MGSISGLIALVLCHALFPICDDSFIGRNFAPEIVFIRESVHHSV